MESFLHASRPAPRPKERAHATSTSTRSSRGIRYCFGASLARVEGQIALRQLVERVEEPRLLMDPPPYRPSPLLRGPSELLVEVDGVRGA